MHYAIDRGDLELVELLLGRNVNLSCNDKNKKTLIQYAANLKRWDIVALIAKKYCADQNDSESYGAALLSIIVDCNDNKKERRNLVHLLLNQGASLKWIYTINKDITHYAIDQGGIKLMKLLLNREILSVRNKGVNERLNYAYDNQKWHSLQSMLTSKKVSLDEVIPLLKKSIAENNTVIVRSILQNYYIALKDNPDLIEMLLNADQKVNYLFALYPSQIFCKLQKTVEQNGFEVSRNNLQLQEEEISHSQKMHEVNKFLYLNQSLPYLCKGFEQEDSCFYILPIEVQQYILNFAIVNLPDVDLSTYISVIQKRLFMIKLTCLIREYVPLFDRAHACQISFFSLSNKDNNIPNLIISLAGHLKDKSSHKKLVLCIKNAYTEGKIDNQLEKLLVKYNLAHLFCTAEEQDVIQLKA